MLGAMIGDMVGAPYEFDFNNYKAKDFPFWGKRSQFTDDTVMTVAVAKALMKTMDTDDAQTIKDALVAEMKLYGHAYPYAGYGGRFSKWLDAKNSHPYNSYGNGSAMRVSSVPWLFANDFEKMRRRARLTAEVTHNHPEGIKGADSTACAIWMAMHGSSKAEIKVFIEKEFGYDLSRTCDEIRPSYRHVESCQETVPQAITAFLESTDFEDAIRTAVSLGGDSDTLACITGGIAEAYYGVPDEIAEECRRRLDDRLRGDLQAFIQIIMALGSKAENGFL